MYSVWYNGKQQGCSFNTLAEAMKEIEDWFRVWSHKDWEVKDGMGRVVARS